MAAELMTKDNESYHCSGRATSTMMAIIDGNMTARYSPNMIQRRRMSFDGVFGDGSTLMSGHSSPSVSVCVGVWVGGGWGGKVHSYRYYVCILTTELFC